MTKSADPLLRPPGGSEEALSAENAQAAIERHQTEGPISSDPVFGRRSLRRIVDLHQALVDDEAFRTLADALAGHLDTDGTWDIAGRHAAEAGVGDGVGQAVDFLLGERNASYANESPFALALAVATAESYGVAENGVADGSALDVVEEARRLVKTHAMAFPAFLNAQCRQTQDLFSAARFVTLYRGERRQHPAEIGAHLPLDMRPLSSWATSRAAARSIAEWGPDAAGAGPHIVLFAADVPVERILSTSATGLGSQSEYEVVLIGGRAGDTCIVIEG